MRAEHRTWYKARSELRRIPDSGLRLFTAIHSSVPEAQPSQKGYPLDLFLSFPTTAASTIEESIAVL
jgi:hypothetical protein